MKSLIYSTVLALLLMPSSPAQTPNVPTPPGGTGGKSGRITDEETKNLLWDCTLPGGNYTVAIGKITSVSTHQYVVKTPTQTATAAPLPTRVYEVNIATDSAMVTRFYYIETAVDGGALSTVKTGFDRVTQVADQAADRTGAVKFWQMVQKDYPLSTHAHTIEYRLESMDDLNRLFASVKRAWTTSKGVRFAIVNQ
jgi:hypothetical protein